MGRVAVKEVEEGARPPSLHKLAGEEPYIIPVSRDMMSEDDLRWLIKATKIAYSNRDPRYWLRMLAFGYVRMWRIENGAEGVILTQLVQRDDGLELFIYSMAGRGIVPALKSIYGQLEKYARDQGCRWVAGNSIHPGLNRYYQDLGFAEEARLMVKELED